MHCNEIQLADIDEFESKCRKDFPSKKNCSNSQMPKNYANAKEFPILDKGLQFTNAKEFPILEKLLQFTNFLL